ncbi:protease HtpX [Sodalis sp. CWE]|uniref:protease HtpX n=1 Tax=Sodalis sp. CWE TaxID=2803816 RepID=UPI001C7CF142|nr:protease HtpX [Sodalis sp. CWE]MBX4181186.1 protease HtpX [Sodalis sp. CWE]
MMRMALFLLTNLAVMTVFGIILSFTQFQPSSIIGMMIIAGLFGFGGSFFSLLISKSTALRLVNGKIIKKPQNEIESWIISTVNQNAKKAHISTPKVALYQADDINAFATGPCRNASLVAISTGLIKNMHHDEIEAVIAHEISHIANGDMVTMTLIQGIVNTFVIFLSRALAQLASGFASSSRNEKENNNGSQMVYFFVSTVLEITFGILANIITLWFSRYREFYADSGSAKLVGRKKMIAALERLKTSLEPQEAESLMALCINGKRNKTFIGELFMSHPPLDKRIEALRSGIYLK